MVLICAHKISIRAYWLEDRGRSTNIFIDFIGKLTLLEMKSFVLLDEENDLKEGIYIFMRIFIQSRYVAPSFIYFFRVIREASWREEVFRGT